MLYNRIFEYILDNVGASAEKRMLGTLKKLGRQPLFADVDLTGIRFNHGLKQRLLRLNDASPSIFQFCLIQLWEPKIFELFPALANPNAAVGSEDYVELLEKFRKYLLSYAKRCPSKSMASSILAAGWMTSMFDAVTREPTPFCTELIRSLDPRFEVPTDDEETSGAAPEPHAAEAAEASEASAAADAPETAEDDAGTPAEPAQEAPQERAQKPASAPAAPQPVVGVRRHPDAAEPPMWSPETGAGPVVKPIIFEDLVKSFSGGAEKRVIAVLKGAKSYELKALGGGFGKLRNRESLRTALLAAEEKAPELFERAMLAVSSGPLNAKLSQLTARFKEGLTNDDRDTVLLQLGQIITEISRARVPELIAGIWRCSMFDPAGRLTSFGRHLYRGLVLANLFDFNPSQRGITTIKEALDVDDPNQASLAAAAGLPAVLEEAAPQEKTMSAEEIKAREESDAKARAAVPRPYRGKAVRQLLLRWILEHVSIEAESRIVALLISKSMRSHPIARGVRASRFKGNPTLLTKILQTDRTDPMNHGLHSILKVIISPATLERCTRAYSSFNPVSRFIDERLDGLKATLADLDAYIKLAGSTTVAHEAAAYLASAWSAGLFDDEDPNAPEAQELSLVGEMMLSEFEASGLIPLSAMIAEDEAQAAEAALRAKEAEERAEAHRREQEMAAAARAAQEKLAREAAEAKAQAKAEAAAAEAEDVVIEAAPANPVEERSAKREEKQGVQHEEKRATEAQAEMKTLAPAEESAEHSDDKAITKAAQTSEGTSDGAGSEPEAKNAEKKAPFEGEAEGPERLEHPDRDPAPGCERWLGFIHRTASFTNFFCFASWNRFTGRFEAQSEESLRIRFPGRGAVNLRGISGSANEGAIYAADIDFSADLKLNVDAATGLPCPDFKYRLDFAKLTRQGRMRRAADLGVYRVVYPETDAVDFRRTIPVRLSVDPAVEPPKGTKAAKAFRGWQSMGISSVPVLLAYRGKLLGPWPLKEDAGHHPYISAPDGIESGLAPSLSPASHEGIRVLEADECYRANDQILTGRSAVVDVEGFTRGPLDVMTDKELLEKAAAVAADEESLAGDELFPEDADISEKRVERVRELLDAARRRRAYTAEVADLALASMGSDALERGPLFEAVLERVFSDAKTLKALGGSPAFVEALEKKERVVDKLAGRIEAERARAQEELSAIAAEAKTAREAHDEALKAFEEARERAEAEFGAMKGLKDIKAKHSALEAQAQAAEERLADLKANIEEFETRSAKAAERAQSYIFDGRAAAKFMEAAADHQHEAAQAAIKARAEVLAGLEVSNLSGVDLAHYLIEGTSASRSYSPNDILNLYLSLTQNFLTVFSGAPGSGKTRFGKSQSL